MASQLGMGDMSILFRWRTPILFRPVQGGPMHVVQVSVCSYVHQPQCMETALISWCPPFPLVLMFFPPSLVQSSFSSEGRDLLETYLLRLNVPISLILSIYNVWLWASVFVHSTRRRFSDDDWARQWSMSIALLLLHSSSRTVMFLFALPLDPWPI